MIKNYFLLFILSALFFSIFQQAFSQDSTYRVLRYITGSGGVLYSQNSQYYLSAISGETILGTAQTENHFLGSGFWEYSMFGFTGVDNNNLLAMPDRFRLYQNYPNPFNPHTVIRYDLPEPSIVNLEVFNILGEKILALINSETKDAGHYQVVWDGRDTYGNRISSGVYLYKIDAIPGNKRGKVYRDIKKMIILK